MKVKFFVEGSQKRKRVGKWGFLGRYRCYDRADIIPFWISTGNTPFPGPKEYGPGLSKIGK